VHEAIERGYSGRFGNVDGRHNGTAMDKGALLHAKFDFSQISVLLHFSLFFISPQRQNSPDRSISFSLLSISVCVSFPHPQPESNVEAVMAEPSEAWAASQGAVLDKDVVEMSDTSSESEDDGEDDQSPLSSEGEDSDEDSDEHSDEETEPFNFLGLPAELLSRTVDCLDLISMTYLRATCRTLRALPTKPQIVEAIVEYECKLEDWMHIVESNGIPKVVAMPIAAGPRGRFHCYLCLRCKDVKEFDVSQFGDAYLSYLMFPWTSSKLRSEDILYTGDGSPRTCIECRLNTPDALTMGIGWLRSYCFDYYIRCSQCLRVEHFPEVFSYRRCGSDDGLEEIRTYPAKATMICHRMVAGKFCYECFMEKNAAWFTFREQLAEEIEAKTKYLMWMIDRDNHSTDRPLTYWEDPAEPFSDTAPIQEVAPYWR
jgi:hypothetical protein